MLCSAGLFFGDQWLIGNLFFMCLGNCRKVGAPHPPRITAKWGYREKHALGRRPHVPQPASNLILARWQGARSPCQARTPIFFSGHVIGAAGTTMQEGSGRSPLFDYCINWGGVFPRTSCSVYLSTPV